MTSRSAGHSSDDAGILLSEDHPSGQGVVRVMILNRPAKRNALNTALAGDLREALGVAGRDRTVRAVVLAGSGSSFCSGGDLAEFRDTADAHAGMVKRARLLAEVLSLLPRLPVPVISAVHGAALGAGAALATGTDMTIGGRDLALGYPEIRDSVVPALVMAGPVHQLSRKLAFEMITTGRRLNAQEALEHGVLNRIVDPGKVLEAAIEVAADWAAVDPQALGETKRLFYRVADLPADAAIQAGVDVTAATWKPPDRAESRAPQHDAI
jgi:enoyl-CoA hydratase